MLQVGHLDSGRLPPYTVLLSFEEESDVPGAVTTFSSLN